MENHKTFMDTKNHRLMWRRRAEDTKTCMDIKESRLRRAKISPFIGTTR